MNVPMFLSGYNDDYHQDLNAELLANFGPNGLVLPPLTTAQITAIAGDMPNGTMWYDSDTDEFKVKRAGTVRVVTTS